MLKSTMIWKAKPDKKAETQRDINTVTVKAMV